MFQRENHFINKRSQKPRRLNLKCIPGVNIVNKTNRNRYNSVLKILCKIFFCQLKQLLLLTLYYTLRLLTIVETKNQIGLCQMFWSKFDVF
jgi:hypothetical protein